MPTGIDYLDETWNPITGCSGSGCKAHCWAREMVKRFPAIHGQVHNRKFRPYPFDVPAFHHDRLDKPLHWRKPRRVGVCFMGDLFDEQVPYDWIWEVFQKMLAASKLHTFFLLTKQIENAVKYFQWETHETGEGCSLADNISLGVSITDQKDADRMIPELLRVPGKKWISIEPMLGPIDLKLMHEIAHCENAWSVRREFISWVVLGCESGPKRRPCPHEWIIDVVRQCKAAGVPVYVKQVDMGKRVSHNPKEWPEELRVREIHGRPD